jgi:hypothetical protein
VKSLFPNISHNKPDILAERAQTGTGGGVRDERAHLDPVPKDLGISEKHPAGA